MTLIAGHPASGHGIPRVSTIVSPPDVMLPTLESRFLWLKRRRLAAAYRQSFAVLAVSQAAAQAAERYYGLRDRRVEVVYNPVQTVPEDTGEKEPGSTDVFTLVCVGRLSVEKGQADLVDAIKLLRERWPKNQPRLKLRLIGDGPLREALTKRWATYADADGTIGGHRLQVCGAIHPSVPEISAADGLVLPSHFEGMPNVVLEAFASRTAVVATASGGTTELAGDADDPTCYLCKPRDPRSLADAIEQLVSDGNGRQHRVQAAVRWIEAHHRVDVAISRISEILVRAAVSPPS